jgi:hypothetical protein
MQRVAEYVFEQAARGLADFAVLVGADCCGSTFPFIG